MDDPHTPSSDMELSKDSVREYVSKKVRPIFERVLQETNKNPMWDEGLVGSKNDFVFYQPHNFRVFMNFDKSSFSTDKPTFEVGWDITKRNYDSEIVIKGVDDCEIIIKKYMVEIRNFVEHKKWFKITLGEKAEEEVLSIVKEKDTQCREALKKVISLFGGNTDFVIRNRFSEDKIEHEDFIDSLPLKMKFKNEIAKKVYNEGNMEFNNPILASNYVRNQALESKTPAILDKLSTLESDIKTVNANFTSALDSLRVEALVPLTEQIKLHLEVQRKTLEIQNEQSKTLRSIRGVLGKKKSKNRHLRAKKLLERWGW